METNASVCVAAFKHDQWKKKKESARICLKMLMFIVKAHLHRHSGAASSENKAEPVGWKDIRSRTVKAGFMQISFHAVLHKFQVFSTFSMD